MQRLEDRLLLASDWQNPVRPLDVNNDGAVTAADALFVINELSRSGGERELVPRTSPLASYWDTSGDGRLSSLDALQIINGLSRGAAGTALPPEAEGDLEPAGFISAMVGQVSGSTDELVDVAVHFEFAADQFNEFGIFVVDTPDGAVSGIPPTHHDYATAVFQSDHRQVVYSRFRQEPYQWDHTIPAGTHLGVYVLQSVGGPTGTAEDHLRVRPADTPNPTPDESARHQVGWERFARQWPAQIVGDRGYDDVIIDLQVGEPYSSCTLFDDNLSGWRVGESGGSDHGAGTVTADNCIATLTEGDSFVVTLEHDFEIPDTPTAIQITLDGPAFDTSDSGFIRDAFEVALLDRDGNSLVAPHAPGRDAFFNITEGMEASAAEAVQFADDVITIGLDGIPTGTEATLIFRLTNDDQDRETSVSLLDVQWVASDLAATSPHGPTGATPAHLRAVPSRIASPDLTALLARSPESADPSLPNHWGDSVIDAQGRFVFGTSEEFERGTLFNLNTNDVPDRLALNLGQNLQTLPIIWIANSGEGTVSKFDTRTGEELGRYRTGPGGDNPSRVAVTRDGDAWVANRGGNNGVVKILHEGFVDRNHNGVIDTSQDLNGDGVISTSELMPWDADRDGLPDDERIAFVNQVGGGPRGVAIDANNKVWVSPYSGTGFRVFDNETGELEEIVPTPFGSYGAVIDGQGHLWSVRNGGGPQILRIDTNTREVVETISVASAYGITVDQDGIVWTSPWSGNTLSRYDPAIGELTTYSIPATSGGGITVDRQGNIWFGTANSSLVWKFTFDEDRKTLLKSESVEVGRNPKSASIDADGYLWTVSLSDNTAWKIDTETNTVVPGWPIPTGQGPYNYSDMTGDRLLTVTQREGTWTEVIDAGRNSAAWAGVEIEAELSGEASLGLRVRTANERDALAGQSWIAVEPNQPLPPMVGRFLEVETRLGSREPDTQPTIDRIEVQAAQPPAITVSQPVALHRHAPGTMLLAGQAIADRPQVGTTSFPNETILVTVNGVPAELLDARGNFFSQIDVLPGLNTLEITAHDRYGQASTRTVTIHGESADDDSLDFSRYADITGSFSGAYFRTSFNEATKLLHVDLATRNDGQFVSDVPLLVGVKNVSDPRVSPVGFDGFTPEGIPYYDYSEFVSAGRLTPGELSDSPTVRFHNPDRVQFDYELVFYGKLNEAPYFTTIPRIEAFTGRTYTYDADAVDPDDDPLAYSLLVAPEGMTINAATGEISWATTNEDIGQHDITVLVTDGRSGSAEQHYTISVTDAPTNRPPVITSTPVTEALVAPVSDTDRTVIDLSTWSVTQYEFNSQPDADWILEEDNTVARQTINADASILLSDFVLENDRIDGTWRVDDGWDDDFMGFVFGFQDEQRFYLFDWKQGEQNDSGWGFAEQGMSVKLINSDVPLTGPDLWATDVPGNDVQVLFRNSIGWNSFIDYRFTLEFTPGRFEITVRDGDQELETIAITDDTYTSGHFGFYNSSQQQVVYSGFTRQTLVEHTYHYDVQAFDPDDDPLSFSLLIAPDGMQIAATDGMLTWAPKADQVGNHPVTVEVSDGRGGVAIQEFIVCVHPDPANHPPTIISQPITSYGLAGHSNPPQGATHPTQIVVPDISSEPVEQTVSLTLPESGGDLGSVDVLFVVDESGSMAGEQAWVADIMATLDASLINAGLHDNRYGLVGFANTGRVLQAGGDRWMSAEDVGVAAGSLRTNRSGHEDGYDGIEFALNSYDFRDDASRVLVLVTDEHRTAVNQSVSFTSIAGRLEDEEIIFSMVANARMEDESGDLAYGVGTDGTSYVADASGGFVVTAGGHYVRSEPVNRGDIARIREHYVDLAWAVDGTVWDLNFLRESESAAAAFTEVFVNVLDENIIRDIPIDVVVSRPDVGFVNLSGVKTDIAPGETVPFDVRFDAATPNRFDLVFVNANTNQILGSIPVNLANLYQYQVVAIDPDDDELTYRLDVAPDGMTIDVNGLITWESPAATDGGFEITVAVDDGRGGRDEQSFTIAVSESGNGAIRGRSHAAPEGLPDRIVYLDQNQNGVRDVGEPFAVTDTLGNYAFVNLPQGTFHVREVVPPGWTPTEPGSSVHVVAVAEGQVIDGIDFVNAAVADAGNRRPVIHSTAVTSGVAGTPYRYDLIADDPDNDAVMFRLLHSPAGMTVHPQRGTVVWNPGEDQVGEHSVVVQASDGRGGSQVQSFTLAVRLPNTAPVITSAPVSHVTAGVPFEHRLRAQDVEGDRVSFRFDGNVPAGMTLDVVQRTDMAGQPMEDVSVVRWNAASSAAGTQWAVMIVAEDGQGGTDTQAWELGVKDGSANNGSPVITSSAPLVARHGLPWVYTLEAADPDGDPIQLELRDAPAGMTVTGDNVVTWTPPASAPSSVPIELAVIDGRGGERVQSFELRVVAQHVNRAPAIISVPRTAAVLGHTYTYDATAHDPDGDPITWELALAPRGISIDRQTGTLRWSPDDQQLGTHLVELVANDGMLGQASQRFEITVGCNNLAPAIVSVPSTVAFTDRPYLYAVRGVDFEGDELTWKLNDAPAGMTIDEQTGLIRWTPGSNQIDSFDVEIEVSDGFSSGRQRYVVVVTPADEPVDPDDPSKGTRANRAPVITSTPVFSGEAESLYSYQVRAFDPDGDAVMFSLGGEVPTGMQIDEAGLITWTPTAGDVGEMVLNVIAADEFGASANQGFLLSVTLNSPPAITSTPPEFATPGATYRYSVRAIDPDGDPLSYRLETAPEGMTIDRFGRVLWTPPPTLATPQDVTVMVSDDRGQTASQPFTITMLADTQTPRVFLSVESEGRSFGNDARVDLGTTYVVRVTATDNVGVAERELHVDGERVALDDAGAVVLSADRLGTVQLEATATDLAGNSATATSTVEIIRSGAGTDPQPGDPNLPPHPGGDPTDNRPPVVEITSPLPGTSVTNVIPILGTVSDPEDNLWYYQVFYARADRVSLTKLDLADPDWVLLHTGTEAVVDGELARFDPSVVTNDPHAIIVAAFDVNGRGSIQPTMVFVEGNVQVGNFRLDFTDLSLPLNGVPIQVTRTYDTLNAADEGDFGFGWTLGVQDARIFEALAIGSGGAFNPGNDKFVPGKTKVYLTNPAGQRVGFTYDVIDIVGSFFGAVGRPTFRPDPGVYDTLTIDTKQVALGGIVGALGGGINPDVYTLTTNEGLRYRYDQFAGLQSITDRNGNVVTFHDEAIRHSSGQAIEFVRDHRGRIKEIATPDGDTLSYEYDRTGNLISFTDLTGRTTRYEYRDDPVHYLDEAHDSLERRVLKAVYEENPRTRQLEFKGVIDAAGNRVDDRDFDTDNNTGVVRDGNGNATTLIYDDRGNVLEEIDPLGNTTFREYSDPRNPDLETRIVDRNGNVTDREYDARGNLLQILERGSDQQPLDPPVTTAFTYDAGNNVTSITNALGHPTSFTYDAKGNLTRITNAQGNSSSFTYDAKGQRTSFTDFNGNTTTFEYEEACPCGSPSKVTHADGTYQTFRYNSFGQTTHEQTFEADGTLVEQQQTFYDSMGRITRELIGGGDDPNHPPTDVRKFYDGHLLEWEIVVSPESLAADGTLLESPATPVAQRKSRITEYKYDERDKLVTQIDAMGGEVDFRYDAQGNRVLLRDPIGNITTWTYDSLNRVAEDRDPFYWVDLVDANSHLSQDELLDAVVVENRQTSTASLAENRGAPHVRSFAYDAEGNQSAIIDRNNRRREFTHDHAGRLLEERWYAADDGPLQETISFRYDALGNMLTASDSNSNYLHTYDTLNRLRSIDNNPNGARDAPRVVLTYGYDSQGNVILTRDNTGVTVASEYDSRNRLAIRRWFDADVPDGETADVDPARIDFFYTATGREAGARRYVDLNGDDLVGRTDRTYDLSGRSDLLTHRNNVDELLAGYDYDYDFGGLLIYEERTHLERQNAQGIDYRHDPTGQLVEANFGGQDDEIYRYDANGNRLHSRVGNDERNYIIDPANRLAGDGLYRYEYDGEGNQIKRIDLATGETRTYDYDHRNRLVRVDDWSRDPGEPSNPDVNAVLLQTVAQQYDVFGRRMSRSSEQHHQPGDSAQHRWFAHDGNNVWTESRDGDSARWHLFGLAADSNLATQTPSEGIRWCLADANGTPRDLLNASGTAHHYATFTSFGAVAQDHGDADVQVGIGGREYDATLNHYHFRSRHYDPSIGRFQSADPISFVSRDPNLYRYAFNSPSHFVDPSGMTAISSYTIATQIGMNDSTMSMIGFMHGLSYSTFAFTGYLLATGSQMHAANLLMRDLSVALAFEWALSTISTGASILDIPIGPLGQLGAYINGINPNSSAANNAVKLLVAEGSATVAILAEAYRDSKRIVDAAKGPTPFDPGVEFSEIQSFGGFINGARAFLTLLR